MSGPVICVPMGVERLALRSAVTPVVPVGIGAERAKRAAAGIGGQARVVAGVGGGLAPRVRVGDVVVATEILGPEGERAACPTAPLIAGGLRRLGLTVHLGPVVSTPKLATGAEARAELVATGALAVDMESIWLAPGDDTVPFAVVRVVSDTEDQPLFHPGMFAWGPIALRNLKRCTPVLDAWAAACEGDGRDITLANPRSFCAGVERAIDVVERALDRFGPPVYVRRQIVHNAHVVADLESRGAVFVAEVDEVPERSVLVLAAHGVSPAVRQRAAERKLSVIDATCPLVTKVHTEVRRHAARGDTVFLIGHADHEEVEGTLGEAPEQVVVVGDATEAGTVTPGDPARVAFAMQTTLATDEAERIADVLRERFPTISGPRRDDICYATTNRQAAVRTLAPGRDLILAVGSANSSNSLRLVEVAEVAGTPARLVDDATGVDLEWLVGARRIGVTAGASAPASLVDDLVAALAGLGPTTVVESPAEPEELHFTLPKEVS